MKKHNLRTLQKSKNEGTKLQMLTCYDYQTAVVMDQTKLDMILVGDSVGNVVLGYDSTVEVSSEEMIIFGKAVKRGAPHKFLVVDIPFGVVTSFEKGLEGVCKIFQATQAEAVKIEGASLTHLQIIARLIEIGIPVMGHIGLMPQSVHAQGGFYKHGKNEVDQKRIYAEALALQEAGCFAVVLECVEESLSKKISNELNIITIGIGSGEDTDGQVLVVNDLFGMGQKYPSFATPLINLFELKKETLDKYLS